MGVDARDWGTQGYGGGGGGRGYYRGRWNEKGLKQERMRSFSLGLREEAKKKGAGSGKARYSRQEIWTPIFSPTNWMLLNAR